MEPTLILHWPLAIGLAAAAVVSRGHRWLVLIGSAAGVVMILYALAYESDEAGFIFSDQDVVIFLAVYWWFCWLGGVGIGAAGTQMIKRRATSVDGSDPGVRRVEAGW